MKVEDLSRYGLPLTMPKEVMRPQVMIIMSSLYRKFGFLGMFLVLFAVLRMRPNIIKAYPTAVAQARALSPDTAVEAVIMVSLFNVVAARENREAAYEFVKDIFQKVAVYSMPAIYQIDELAACEGDAFTNFKTFNAAMFTAIHEDGTWKNNGIYDDENVQRFQVTSCANVEIFTAMDCPELGKLGCDHDLAGYPLILDKVDAEFHRPCTLAKGGTSCDFYFYRKGTAPATDQPNM